MITLPWIVRALNTAGFDTGWAVSGDEIVLWENSEPQPTIKELEELLSRDSE
jgi:hypothetical protein